jgi:hypothetical protein
MSVEKITHGGASQFVGLPSNDIVGIPTSKRARWEEQVARKR